MERTYPTATVQSRKTVPSGVEQLAPQVDQNVPELLARALRLRCPVCGSGGIFASWFRIQPQCPSCGFALRREEGYFSGAMAMNLMISEFGVTAVLVALMIKTWPLMLSWPSPELLTIWFASIVAAGILPLLTFPWSRTLWVAFDLLFRPPTEADFQQTIPTVR